MQRGRLALESNLADALWPEGNKNMPCFDQHTAHECGHISTEYARKPCASVRDQMYKSSGVCFLRRKDRETVYGVVTFSGIFFSQCKAPIHATARSAHGELNAL
jgi:hypothetical protein